MNVTQNKHHGESKLRRSEHKLGENGSIYQR